MKRRYYTFHFVYMHHISLDYLEMVNDAAATTAAAAATQRLRLKHDEYFITCKNTSTNRRRRTRNKVNRINNVYLIFWWDFSPIERIIYRIYHKLRVLSNTKLYIYTHRWNETKYISIKSKLWPNEASETHKQNGPRQVRVLHFRTIRTPWKWWLQINEEIDRVASAQTKDAILGWTKKNVYWLQLFNV